MSNMGDEANGTHDKLLAGVISGYQNRRNAGHTVYILFIDSAGNEQRRIMHHATKDARCAALAEAGITEGLYGVAVDDHHLYHIHGNDRELMSKVRYETGRHGTRMLYTEELTVKAAPQAAAS